MSECIVPTVKLTTLSLLQEGSEEDMRSSSTFTMRRLNHVDLFYVSLLRRKMLTERWRARLATKATPIGKLLATRALAGAVACDQGLYRGGDGHPMVGDKMIMISF
ncbi:hypothetical protein B296_00028592 [Ensete ventricosum]|uniref:Uncharacterized protein n=1 Tax=Ensete ventricosum TaxID=4639 RepID=A0A426YIS7_ENSVE|nr:hypothetical protein B296_00028592 [Ensete ventricosum]